MEVEGYPDYMIYEDGRVWSKYGKGKFLKTFVNGCGYVVVGLYKDGKAKHMTIHRLLGKAFIPNPENKPCIDHKDINRQNNDISNLRWATYSENNHNIKAYGAIPFKGVAKDGKGFRARIRIDGKEKYLGYYKTAEKASEAYIQYCTNNNIML